MILMMMMTTTRMHTADAFSLADTIASHASYILQKMKSTIVYDSTGQSAPTKSIEQIKIRGDSRDSVFETDDVAPMTEEEVEESLAEHEDAEEEGEEGPYVVRKTPSSDGGKIEEGEEQIVDFESWDDVSGEPLNTKKVQQAREEKLREFRKHMVYRKVPIRESYETRAT